MHAYQNAHFPDETCYPRGLRKAGYIIKMNSAYHLYQR